MKTNKIKSFLLSEDGHEEATRFIKAIEEQRVFTIIRKNVTSGSYLTLHERGTNNNYNYSLFFFAKSLGIKTKDNYLYLSGYQYNKTLHLISYLLGILEENGYNTELAKTKKDNVQEM